MSVSLLIHFNNTQSINSNWICIFFDLRNWMTFSNRKLHQSCRIFFSTGFFVFLRFLSIFVVRIILFIINKMMAKGEEIRFNIRNQPIVQSPDRNSKRGQNKVYMIIIWRKIVTIEKKGLNRYVQFRWLDDKSILIWISSHSYCFKWTEINFN